MFTRLAVIAIFFFARFELQAQETQPATQAGDAQALIVTITGVEGNVQVRASQDAAWQKAEVGQTFSQDAEFRTGLKSAVRFTIPPDQTITLDRLGTVKVLRAIEENGTIKTDLGMKYGRTRYDIAAGGRQHEAQIRSPSSTLAVRGTKVSLYDQRPFVPQAVSLTGRAQFRDFRKSVAFGGPGAGKAKITQAHSSAAATAMENAVVDPTIARARTAQEQQLVDTLISRGAITFFDNNAGIDVITGGTVPNDRELVNLLPGPLSFVLRWTGNADLNLHVSFNRGQGESVFPIGGLNIAPSGGRTTFDHRGGPNGGIEIVSWPDNPPTGPFTMAAVLVSGEPAEARFNAYRNGEKIDLTDFTQGFVFGPEVKEPLTPRDNEHNVYVPVDEPRPGANHPAVNRNGRSVPIMGPLPAGR